MPSAEETAISLPLPESLAGVTFIEEYKFLNAVKLALVSERRRVETQVLIAVLAIYSWLFTRPPPIDPALFNYVLTLPTFVVVVGLARYFGLQYQLLNVVQYEQAIEKMLFGDVTVTNLGWESWIERERASKILRRRSESWSEILVFVMGIFFTIGTYLVFKK